MDNIQKAINILRVIKKLRGRYVSPFLLLNAIGIGICVLVGVNFKVILFMICFYYVIKYFYIYFWRKDANPDLPVLKRFNKTVHGSHRGGAWEFGPENTLFNFV